MTAEQAEARARFRATPSPVTAARRWRHPTPRSPFREHGPRNEVPDPVVGRSTTISTGRNTATESGIARARRRRRAVHDPLHDPLRGPRHRQRRRGAVLAAPRLRRRIFAPPFRGATWARAAGGNRACLAGQRFKKGEFLRRFERLSNDNALVDRLACQLDTPKGSLCRPRPGRHSTRRDKGTSAVQWPAAERRT